VCAAVTVLAFLAASLLGVLHEATTVHVRCAAHGELIDSSAAVASAVPAVRDSIAPAPGSARGHGDDHCLLASAVRASRILSTTPAIASAAVAVDEVVIAAPSAIPQVAARVDRVAPKTSPPA
jgi:hypothetical protein